MAKSVTLSNSNDRQCAVGHHVIERAVDLAGRTGRTTVANAVVGVVETGFLFGGVRRDVQGLQRGLAPGRGQVVREVAFRFAGAGQFDADETVVAGAAGAFAAVIAAFLPSHFGSQTAGSQVPALQVKFSSQAQGFRSRHRRRCSERTRGADFFRNIFRRNVVVGATFIRAVGVRRVGVFRVINVLFGGVRFPSSVPSLVSPPQATRPVRATARTITQKLREFLHS